MRLRMLALAFVLIVPVSGVVAEELVQSQNAVSAAIASVNFKCENEEAECKTLCNLAQSYCDTATQVCSDIGYRPWWTHPIWVWNCERLEKKCTGYFNRWQSRCHGTEMLGADLPWTTAEDERIPFELMGLLGK